jgi:hypothetical protein
MAQIYTGKVIFPASNEPYSGPFGPSYNVKVELEQQSAPKSDERNQTVIYKKADSPEINYLRSLGKDDKVTLLYKSSGDGKEWYEFIIPTHAEPKKPPKQAKPAAYYDTDDWMELAQYVWDTHILACMKIAAVDFPDIEASELADLAITLFINTDRAYKGGMRAPEVVEETELDGIEEVVEKPSIKDRLEPLMNETNWVDSLMAAVLKVEPFFKSKAQLITALKSMGFSGEDIDSAETWMGAAVSAVNYADHMQSQEPEF